MLTQIFLIVGGIAFIYFLSFIYAKSAVNNIDSVGDEISKGFEELNAVFEDYRPIE